MKKFLVKILYGVFILLLVGVAALFFVPLLPIKGNVEIKIVKSGSMEPYIKTGSIVIIKPAANYKVGEVITFGEDNSSSFPTTHRIVSISEERGLTLYQVKGDANEEPDPTLIRKSDIEGKVIFTVPNAGYLLDFARQPAGFILLIAFPAALIILNEIIDIGKEIHKIIRRRKGDSVKILEKKVLKRLYKIDDVLRPVYLVHSGNTKRKGDTPLIISFLVFLGTSLAFAGFGSTVSYFSDAENSLGNIMSAIAFEISASASPEESYVGESGGSTVISTVNLNPSGPPHDYRITVEKTGGSDAFCQALIMNSTSTPPFAYNGSILNFTSSPTAFSGNWQFEVNLSLNAGSFGANDMCIIDFIYSADTWLADKVLYGGYSDVERVTLTFEASEASGQDVVIENPVVNPVVLNEIYANPDASSTAPLDREYIELYNNSDVSIDVLGWWISELVGDGDIETFHTIVSQCTTPVTGKISPYNGASTILGPGQWLVLQFCPIPQRLNNDGDTVRLYGIATTTLLDSHTYPSTTPGKSHARIPDGTGAWVDPIPTPGGPNMLDSAENSESTITVVEEISEENIETATSTAGQAEETIVEEIVPEETEEAVVEPAEEILTPISEDVGIEE